MDHDTGTEIKKPFVKGEMWTKLTGFSVSNRYIKKYLRVDNEQTYYLMVSEHLNKQVRVCLVYLSELIFSLRYIYFVGEKKPRKAFRNLK